MAAGKNPFNIYTTYYESFLALSVSIRVDEHQLMMETPSSSQAPVLRYRDITFTTEYLKESLSAVCPVLGVHNVARVRQGASLPLVEVDFTDEKALEKFCKSIFDGKVCKNLQQRFEQRINDASQRVDVAVRLYLITPNAEKKSPISREITMNNHQEGFSIIRDSALFEFVAFNIAKECTQQAFDSCHLGELLQELKIEAARWYTVGIFLKMADYKLDEIRNNNSGRSNQSMDCLREMLATWLRGTDASPAALVQALRSAGMIGLAKKLAFKYGVQAMITVEPQETTSQDMAANLFQALSQFFAHAQDFRQRSESVPEYLSTLVIQRKGIADKDMQRSALIWKLMKLNKSKAIMTETLEQAKFSLKTMKDQISKMKQEHQRLIEQREKKRSTKKWLFKQKSSKSDEEDLDHLDQLITDIEEAIAILTKQINELESKIESQNEQAHEITLQLEQKEQEKRKQQVEIDEVHKEKQSLERILEEERRNFEKEILRVKNESEIREELLREELSHKRMLELQSAKNSVEIQEKTGEVHVATENELKTKRSFKRKKMSEEEELPLKLDLFCFHPVYGRLSRDLEVHQNKLMLAVTKKAHEVMDLSPHVPIDCCRLVKYDGYTDTIYESFDPKMYAVSKFCKIMGRTREHYSYELLLEICGEEKQFKKYNKGGLKLKILVVDIHKRNVHQPVILRAELDWTIGMLKNEISKVCSLDQAVMDLMLELRYKGKHLSNDSKFLRHEDFYKNHNVYARSDLCDHHKPFYQSLMKEVVDAWIGSIVLHITIPPRPRPRSISGYSLPYKQSALNKRELSLRVCRHTTLLQLKTKLEEHMGVSSHCFQVLDASLIKTPKIDRMMERLTDELRFSLPLESHLVLKLGETLKPGEYCARLFLLKINEPEYFKFMMESIVPANSTVLEFKQQIAKEAQEQDIDLDPAKMRLRRKMHHKLGLVYLDSEIMNKDIYLYNGIEMYIEPLSRPDPKKRRTQKIVYIRWWHPSSYTVEPTQEIVLSNTSPAELRSEISRVSGIPSEQVSFAKGTDVFPCKCNVWYIEEKIEWDPSAEIIEQALNDDGGVIYFKCCTEKQLMLPPEKKAELYACLPALHAHSPSAD